MSVKFVFINDVHLRATTPRARKECDYLEEILSDLEIVFEYCVKNKIKYILCAGDLFDSPNQSSRVIYKLIMLFKKYQGKVTFITILGNHDILNRNSENYSGECSVSILEAANCLVVLYEGDNYDLGDNVHVYGFGSDEDMTDLFIEGNSKSKPDLKTYNIAMVHYPIGGENSTHCAVTVDKCKINPKHWNLVLFGDIHDFVDVGTTDKGLNYICNGAFCKSSISDIGRKKLFSVVEIDPRGKDRLWKQEWVEVPSPSDEDMFDMVKYEERDEKEAKAFKAAISRAGLSKNLSPIERVKKVAEDSDFSEESKNKVMEGIRKYG